MSSPIEKRKEQLKAMLSFDSYTEMKAEQTAEGMGFFNGGFRQYEPKSAFMEGAKWGHKIAANESAQIARDLLDALEALERIEDVNLAMKEQSPNRPSYNNYELRAIAREILGKLSKGDE